MAAMVVQFGLAMMPLRASRTAWPLTSLTTSGTSGSIRQAEELSMTVAPAAANRGACTREVAPPAEKSAMSRPLGSAVSASSTVTVVPRHGRVEPAERDEAKNRTCPDREVPLLEQSPHDGADLPGRADDAHGQAVRAAAYRAAHRPVPP